MSKQSKILLLGDVNSIHLHKWILALKDHFQVLVFSFDVLQKQYQWLAELEGVELQYAHQNTSNSKNVFTYLKQVKQLKAFYKQHQPDITHAHYATSYGMLGALCRPKNYCISAWGTDVYLFPKTSPIHRFIFKWIIGRANYLFATSNPLANELKQYTSKSIEVIPFGIDTQLFAPNENIQKQDVFTIGTVKGLDLIYGIDRLIDAFATFHKKHPYSQCVIYGKGPHQQQFEQQIKDLGLTDKILLKGFVENTEVPTVLNTFDAYCALSRSESFGVAVIEASACELPVIVSNIGGLTEVVRDNETGFIVDAENQNEIVGRFENLYENKELRKKMGQNGRIFVYENFEWSKNAMQQIQFYNGIIATQK